VLVALARDLLRARQERLDLAEVDEAVAGVRLLDDARHDVAHAVLVLLEHHLALGLADPLQDHLLGGLGRDATEVVARDVDDLDRVLRHPVPVQLGLGLLDDRLLRRVAAEVVARTLALALLLRRLLGLRLRLGVRVGLRRQGQHAELESASSDMLT
jgi:hypothetical protein